MCSFRHSISLLPVKRHCPLIRLWAQWQRKVLLDCLEGNFWTITEKHTEPSSYWVQAGENEEVLLSREREGRNYDLSIALSCLRLNICTEALCNIIQARGDSTVICYPCVPSESKEERQATWTLISYMPSMVEGSIYRINSSFCFYRTLRTERRPETMSLLNFNSWHGMHLLYTQRQSLIT